MPDRPTPASDPLGLVPQLVTLAADQAETRSRLDQLATVVEEAGGQLADLAGTRAAAEADLAAVRTALQELTEAVGRLAAEPDKSPLWTWVDLDTGARREALRELAEWIGDVLVDRYQIGDQELPRCWYRHPGAVEELSWLYLDWARVYRGKGGSTAAAGEWNDRWLPGVLARIVKRLAGCRRGHRDQMEQPPPATDTGFETFLNTLGRPEPAVSPASPWGQHEPPTSPTWRPG